MKIEIDRLGNISPEKKKYNKVTDTNTVSEPGALFEPKKWVLKKFDNFDEMESDQLKHFASLTTTELLANLKKLTLAAFGISNEKDMKISTRRIKF